MTRIALLSVHFVSLDQGDFANRNIVWKFQIEFYCIANITHIVLFSSSYNFCR